MSHIVKKLYHCKDILIMNKNYGIIIYFGVKLQILRVLDKGAHGWAILFWKFHVPHFFVIRNLYVEL